LSETEVQYLEYRLRLLRYVQQLSGERNPRPSLVLPQLYISDLYSATSPQTIDDLGITHILSLHTANTDLPFGTKRFRRLSIELEDTPKADLHSHLPLTIDFLRQSLSSNHEDSNRVLVHCTLGNGPSAAVIIAFLIAAYHMNYDSALAHLNAAKGGVDSIRINSGFEMQLRRWEEDQRRELEDALVKGLENPA
jgi:atypical dual specificity phosphatase